MAEEPIRFIWYGPDSDKDPSWMQGNLQSRLYFWKMLSQDPHVFTVIYYGLGPSIITPAFESTPTLLRRFERYRYTKVSIDSFFIKHPVWLTRQLEELWSNFCQNRNAITYLENLLSICRLVEYSGEVSETRVADCLNTIRGVLPPP